MSAPVPVALGPATSGGGGGSLVGFLVVFGLVIVTLLLFSSFSARRERGRRRGFLAQATERGWYEPSPADFVPPSVTAAEDPASLKLLLTARRDGENIWVAWNRPEQGAGPRDATAPAAREGGPRDLTRYFVRAAGHPDPISFLRRGPGGASALVRGAGTGDPAFDRAFAVLPEEGAPVHLLTETVRREMIAGLIPLWEIDATGMLVTRYEEEPEIDAFDRHADALLHLLGALSGA